MSKHITGTEGNKSRERDLRRKPQKGNQQGLQIYKAYIQTIIPNKPKKYSSLDIKALALGDDLKFCHKAVKHLQNRKKYGILRMDFYA